MLTHFGQIPAVAFELLDKQNGIQSGHGVTLVVSPLLSLMKDQVGALRKRNIAAESMDSTKSFDEMQLVRTAIRKGHLKILYCAPERLNNEAFVESIKDMPGGIRLLAVDEAHCISEVLSVCIL
jgi:superfamily II DNA helicase RecQ